MKTNGRELIFTDYFLEQVAAIQVYISQFSEKRSRQLTSAMMDFATDRIPLNPYAFVEYSVMKTRMVCTVKLFLNAVTLLFIGLM